MTLTELPTVNASLNAVSTVLLFCGYIAVRKGRPDVHRNFMVAAMATSALFLACYLYYHFHFPTTKYQGQGALRYVYFSILITHVLLAMVVPPAAIAAVWHAWKGRFDRHVRVTRWLWPVWMYVSVTGVVVYLMLYVF
jgi:putative membrane protein